MTPPESSPEDLQQSLTRVHAHLSANPSVDENSQRLLRHALGEVERHLGDSNLAIPAQESAADSAAAHRPSSRLQALAAAFDAEHPTLSASLRELVDLLGRAGL